MSSTDMDVPGTVHLIDLDDSTLPTRHADGSSNIILVPQPSSSPNDPLNWSKARKMWALSMTLVYTWGTGLPVTLHYSLIVQIQKQTGITVEDLVQGNGLMFLFLGLGCLFWQPIASAYGRRCVYLISTLLLVPLMVWTSYTTTSGTWFAQRILIGIVVAPIEALPELSITDLFFAHERGTWMSVYVLMLFESNFVAPLIAGWLEIAIGWRWVMFFGSFWAAAAFIILLVGMEETMYVRHKTEGSATPPQVFPEPTQRHELQKDETSAGAFPLTNTSSAEQQDGTVADLPTSWKQRLRLVHPSPTRPPTKTLLKMMLMPLAIIIQFPSIAWAGFIYGVNLSWYNVLNGTVSPVLSAAPYHWSAAAVGSIYAGPMIGALFGCLWSGLLSDRFAIWMARRNGGTREPEHRLWPLTMAGLATTIGLILWGVGAAKSISWVALATGLAILTFGVVVGGSIALSYAVDCFKEISGLSLASVIVVRNVLGFAVAYGITPWYTGMGLQNCFISAGFISLACMMSFLLLIWKGKSLRRAAAPRFYRYVNSGLGAH